MTVRSFPCTNIWGGFLYLPSSQAIKVLAAFHGFVARADASNPGLKYDEFAAGPMACFTYIQKLGIQAISVNLVSTQPPESQEKWPPCWKTSGFKSLWWFWNTCKTRSLTSMTDEMCALNPPGKRQVFATTTVQNDTSTLAVAHSAYYNAISSIRHVKGMIWTLVLQPFLPIWARKGFGNPLGLDEGTPEPLVIVSFTINWTDQKDDECVKATTRQAIEQIDDFATINKTGHRYRYLNYCGEWQDPFKGYGEENLRFLQATSRKYDPEGLFQKGCTGGFKLGMPDKGSGALQ
ncbi:MAG: hypothetical protein M1821_003550 [Bathelium mastoideum]|nr:MAG: hypothetical protein M1821_003550 [Bathelium mastoideum]